MELSAHRVEYAQIAELRLPYQREMNCQIIHDSIHSRKGWTEEFGLFVGGTLVGYGSLAVSGPWKECPSIYEFYLLSDFRGCSFALFTELLRVSGSKRIETQSNDTFLTVMLHAYSSHIYSESILFQEGPTTTHRPSAAEVRAAESADLARLEALELDAGAKWVVTSHGEVVGAGDILYHYNRPYGDIYMKIGASFRRRGLGAFLVQELQRICREDGSVPAARCNLGNLASRKTLQKAGLVPCGHILIGHIQSIPET